MHLEILLDAQEDTSSAPGNTSRCRGSKNTFAKAPAISATTIADIAIGATLTPIAMANIAAKFVAATPIGSRKWQLLTHYSLRVHVGRTHTTISTTTIATITTVAAAIIEAIIISGTTIAVTYLIIAT